MQTLYFSVDADFEPATISMAIILMMIVIIIIDRLLFLGTEKHHLEECV